VTVHRVGTPDDVQRVADALAPLRVAV